MLHSINAAENGGNENCIFARTLMNNSQSGVILMSIDFNFEWILW